MPRLRGRLWAVGSAKRRLRQQDFGELSRVAVLVFVQLRNPVSHAQGLEASRFVALQLYRLGAGGSRERLEVRQFYGPLYPRNRTDAMGKTLR